MKQRIIVLGSTGSIGRNALDVLASMSETCEVVGLAAASRAAELAAQADRFRTEAVALADGDRLPELRGAMRHGATVYSGSEALVKLVEEVACNCVLVGVVGAGGLAATMRAVELGRRVALANKETLVMAGALIMPLAARTGAKILPVDSEHSAIFQAMQAGQRTEVEAVYLTASGGPFFDWSAGEMEEATLEDALRHPTWAMGPKTTIDSATMMNKALEIVEARWLFDLSPERIKVVIHPESIIHSLVEFCDGSLMAQLSRPDMRMPIQYAITFPARRPCPARRLDLYELGQLTLLAPDAERFPALGLGHAVAARGGTAGAVMNAANEAAVTLFREGAIHFRDIARCVEQALEEHAFVPQPTLEDLWAADHWARQKVTQCVTC